MFSGNPGVLSNGSSSLESTYNPSVPVSVGGARSLSYTHPPPRPAPLPPLQNKASNNKWHPSFWILELFGSLLTAWVEEDPSTSEPDHLPIVQPDLIRWLQYELVSSYIKKEQFCNHRSNGDRHLDVKHVDGKAFRHTHTPTHTQSLESL